MFYYWQFYAVKNTDIGKVMLDKQSQKLYNNIDFLSYCNQLLKNKNTTLNEVLLINNPNYLKNKIQNIQNILKKNIMISAWISTITDQLNNNNPKYVDFLYPAMNFFDDDNFTIILECLLLFNYVSEAINTSKSIFQSLIKDVLYDIFERILIFIEDYKNIIIFIALIILICDKINEQSLSSNSKQSIIVDFLMNFLNCSGGFNYDFLSQSIFFANITQINLDVYKHLKEQNQEKIRQIHRAISDIISGLLQERLSIINNAYNIMFEDQKQFKKITQALCLTIIDVHKQTSLFGEIHYFITFLQLLKNKILVNPKYINSTEFIIDFFNGFTKNIYLSPMTNFSQSYFLGSVFFNKSLMNILQSNEISDLTIDVNEEFISNIKTNPTLTLITLCQQNNIQEIWFKIVKLLFNQRINKTFINLVNQHKQFLKTESENFYNLMLIE